jgi:hypothetical protein
VIDGWFNFSSYNYVIIGINRYIMKLRKSEWNESKKLKRQNIYMQKTSICLCFLRVRRTMSNWTGRPFESFCMLYSEVWFAERVLKFDCKIIFNYICVLG